jgi:hypothetical protein
LSISQLLLGFSFSNFLSKKLAVWGLNEQKQRTFLDLRETLCLLENVQAWIPNYWAVHKKTSVESEDWPEFWPQ